MGSGLAKFGRLLLAKVLDVLMFRHWEVPKREEQMPRNI